MFSTTTQTRLKDYNKQLEIHKILNQTLVWSYSLDGYCRAVTSDRPSPEQVKQLLTLEVDVKSKPIDLITLHKRDTVEYQISFRKNWKLITPINVIMFSIILSIAVLIRALMIY